MIGDTEYVEKVGVGGGPLARILAAMLGVDRLLTLHQQSNIHQSNEFIRLLWHPDNYHWISLLVWAIDFFELREEEMTGYFLEFLPEKQEALRHIITYLLLERPIPLLNAAQRVVLADKLAQFGALMEPHDATGLAELRSADMPFLY